MSVYKKYKELIKDNDFKERDYISLRSILNGYKKVNITQEQKEELKEDATNRGLHVSKEQTEKGYKWLMNLYKTPKGKERKNNPFGHREEKILENFSHFMFYCFYDAKESLYMSGYHDYLPVWEVIDKDGDSFTYYNDYREDYQGINITG